MKKYETPEIELLSFVAEDLMFGSDENETPQDKYDGILVIDEI